ncbi:MAG: recombinase family protein [Mycobacterium sp.]
MRERAALYARISFDRNRDEVGVDRQLARMRERAVELDYDVVAEVKENNVSATKGLHRPGYERIRHLVTTEQIDHVMVWQTSRLVRSRADRAEVISTFGTHKVDIVAVEGPSLDLRTAYGRGMADLLTAFDSLEGEVKAERVSAAIADMAQRGHAWGFCPYGWDRTGRGIHAEQTVNEAEADVVRELVDRLLAGESLHSLYQDMNRRGVPAPGHAQWLKLPEDIRAQRQEKGKLAPTQQWAKSTVRTLVVRDANVAVRRYRKRADHGGTEMKGGWPAIVDRDKHDRVVALLASPERRSHTGPRPGARKHLLTQGIGRCGVCGDVLRVAKRSGRRDATLIYMCNSPRGCTGRVQAHVDNLLARVIIGRLAMPDALDWLLGDDELARQWAKKCDELQGRLDEAADSQADGKIDIRQLERITARLRPQLEAAQRERDTAMRSLDVETLRPLAGPEAEKCWEAMSVAQKRAVLETLRVEVVLLPRVKHGPGFEPETVDITFRT